MSSVNLDVATLFVADLWRAGLRRVCIAPGSRSGPLAVAVARHPKMHAWIHVDERSAGFFAVGLAKRSGEPAAVLTTSGTAAAELHAAVLEAYHSRTPLLVLTADRPPEMRDRGANQTITQSGLFGGATRWSFDPGPPTGELASRFWSNLAGRAVATTRAPVAGPVHLNLPFREPLLPSRTSPSQSPSGSHEVPHVAPGVRSLDATGQARLKAIVANARRIFVHAGTLPVATDALSAVSDFASRSGAVVHAEPTSQLRRAGVRGLLHNTEALLRDSEFAERHGADLVIRLGAAPTSRALGKWLQQSGARRVLLVDPDAVWPDPDGLATDVVQSDVVQTLQALTHHLPAPGNTSWQAAWLAADRAAGAAIEEALGDSPLCEAQVVRTLARTAGGTTVVVGSSMAIRDADWFWPPDETSVLIANRGASGIDGFVSTALGAAAANDGEPTLALCGDLTLYHDMNGLLAATRKDAAPVTFVVLNNNGGGIFSFLREAEYDDVFEEVFATPTDLDVQRVAALYGCAYHRCDDLHSLQRALAECRRATRCCIVDVRFRRDESVKTHGAAWAAASAAIRAVRRAAPGT
jgi:2-succinyl-5-enolpyruvyl-6-hydroxy-3-cyclohexene-1-carboxylate synthase